MAHAHTWFTDRSVGNLAGHVDDDPAAVEARRSALAARLGVAAVVVAEQVHGTEVAVVDHLPAAPPVVDALVTTTPGLALAAVVADCVPVLLADEAAGVVAAVHAGRRGAAAGVVPRALEAMAGLGARPERVRAELGPSICGRCYELPEEVVAAVSAELPGSRATTRAGTPSLDVAAGLEAQLRGLGVVAVRRSPVCTAESVDHYSYRREHRTGRFAGVVWLAP